MTAYSNGPIVPPVAVHAVGLVRMSLYVPVVSFPELNAAALPPFVYPLPAAISSAFDVDFTVQVVVVVSTTVSAAFGTVFVNRIISKSLLRLWVFVASA